MREYGIESLILTMLGTWRRKLITAEKMKHAYKGKLKNEKDWKKYQISVYDDLENFFCNLKDGGIVNNEMVRSFFMPKLTEKEMDLVQKKDKTHLKTWII